MIPRRVVIVSVSSIVWPAIVLLVQAAITCAPARVYAESATVATPCPGTTDADRPGFSECEDKSEFSACECASPPCICQQSSCIDGTRFRTALRCVPALTCTGFESFAACVGKQRDDECTSATEPGRCMAGKSGCLGEDGGYQPNTLVCVPSPPQDGGAAVETPASGEEDDGGCSATGSRSFTAPLMALPLLFALLGRRRQPKKAPSARKRS